MITIERNETLMQVINICTDIEYIVELTSTKSKHEAIVILLKIALCMWRHFTIKKKRKKMVHIFLVF